jgi:RsiW-degrading membrane proteinase PrsW (M82 family)
MNGTNALNETALAITNMCQSLQGLSSLLTAVSIAAALVFSALSYFFYSKYSKSKNPMWLAALLLSLLAVLGAAVYLIGMAANTVIYGPPPQC